MSILPFRPDWLVHIKDVDVKSCDWPWCDEQWADISKYIIRTWWDSGILKGFSAFQFNTKGFIPISKLAIYPKYQNESGEAMLLEDIEKIAKKHSVPELRITIWEHDGYRLKMLRTNGFKAIGLRGKYPDGSDGYEFRRFVHGC